MSRQVIKLGNDVELIIDDPPSISSSERSALVVSVLADAALNANHISPIQRERVLPFQIGSNVYRVYYSFKVRRIVNLLELCSNAILHIKQNPDQYDQRLACKAIELLRQTFAETLK